MTKLIVANWKSNHNKHSAIEWLNKVNSFLQEKENNLSLVLAPPFPILSAVGDIVEANGIKLAVQDLSQFSAGSYTGAVCADNLQDLGINYAILGHSERRRYFQETDEVVAQKVQQALEANINPVLCLDEPYLESQLKVLQETIQEKEKLQNSLVIAYEPLQAIGTGQSEDPEHVGQIVAQVKATYQVPVLYGGSVNSENVSQFLAVSDGVLVGSASLEADSFIFLLQSAQS